MSVRCAVALSTVMIAGPAFGALAVSSQAMAAEKFWWGPHEGQFSEILRKVGLDTAHAKITVRPGYSGVPAVYTADCPRRIFRQGNDEGFLRYVSRNKIITHARNGAGEMVDIDGSDKMAPGDLSTLATQFSMLCPAFAHR